MIEGRSIVISGSVGRYVCYRVGAIVIQTSVGRRVW